MGMMLHRRREAEKRVKPVKEPVKDDKPEKKTRKEKK